MLWFFFIIFFVYIRYYIKSIVKKKKIVILFQNMFYFTFMYGKIRLCLLRRNEESIENKIE